MKRASLVAGAVLAAVTGAAAATSPVSPYAGQEARRIKALSPEEIDGYLAGEGSGFAKAAELNHYPGPAHVLELADSIGLTPDQRDKTRAIFRDMRETARRLGAELVAAERALDRLFASGRATPEALHAALERIGAVRTELRRVHLQAHLDQRLVLTDAQVRDYDRRRGYGGAAGHGHGGHHGH